MVHVAVDDQRVRDRLSGAVEGPQQEWREWRAVAGGAPILVRTKDPYDVIAGVQLHHCLCPAGDDDRAVGRIVDNRVHVNPVGGIASQRAPARIK